MNRALEAAQGFVGQVRNLTDLHGEGPVTPSLSLTGGRALARMLLARPAFTDGPVPQTVSNLFGTDPGGRADPGLEGIRHEVLTVAFSGALALGMAGVDVPERGRGLVLTALDPDFRRDLVGKPFGPPVPDLPDWAVDARTLLDSTCMVGVLDAIHALGARGSAQSTSDTKGITGLSTSAVCPGSIFAVLGTGFGAQQPRGTSVYVPTVSGGCRSAEVTSWSDTRIEVRAPQDVAPGCVGFVRDGGGTWTEPSNVGGALSSCLGAVGEVWGAALDRLRGPVVTCPPCMLGGQNRLTLAGPPRVSFFRCSPEVVEPGERPELTWSTDGATSVTIEVLAAGLPPLQLPGTGPAGSQLLPPATGLQQETTSFRLTASNACGSVTASAAVLLTRRPHLSIDRIEVVQGEQDPGNGTQLAAGRRTAVRVFVGSGITDGFDIGDGPGRVGGLEVALDAYDASTGTVTSCGPSWDAAFTARATADRDVLGDSLNFEVPLGATHGTVRFRATVLKKAAERGAPPVAFATAEATVSFREIPAQELLPLLVSDPLSTASMPTMVDFMGDLDGPVRMHPFPAGGFVVNPPLTWPLAAQDSLFSTLGWERAVARLATMFFLFPSQPVGGIRMAIAPADAPVWGGMALPRIGLTIPSLIVKAGQPTTCTHELGHAFGLQHVQCGSPAGPFDGRLPFTLANPAVDVALRQLWPSATTNESMTYCYPQWPSRQHWDVVLNGIPS